MQTSEYITFGEDPHRLAPSETIMYTAHLSECHSCVPYLMWCLHVHHLILGSLCSNYWPNEVIGLKSAFILSYYILNISQFFACLLSSITIFKSSFSSYFHFSLPTLWFLLLFLLLGKTSLEKWIAK